MPSPTTTDWELLQAYARQRSEPAFEALVSRYLDLVHSAAFRQVRDPQLAQDVSQAVFIVLARKAGRLSRHVSLAGWLFRTTRFVAARAVRAEQRRRWREREAVIMQTPPHAAELWAEVEPMLDEAVAQLPRRDRDAILMRFFLRHNLKEVGAKLGTSEEAAKKRVARAVDKLRAFFARRGFTISGALMASALASQAVQAAPPGTSDAVTRAVHAGAAALPAPLTLLVSETLRELAASKARLALTWSARSVVVLLLGALVWQIVARSVRLGAVDPGLVAASTSLGAVNLVKQEEATDTANESGVGTLPLRVVAADDGHALAGADLIVNYWQVGATRLNLTTDSQGHCAVPLAGREFDILRVWVSAAGFVPKVINWHDYELGVKNEEYTIRLEAGLVVGGVVQDQEGQPIADASIRIRTPGMNSAKRENVGYNPSRDFALSDTTGRWVFRETHGLSSELTFFVTHSDHARLMTYVDMTQPDHTNLVWVLSSGIPLSGIVLTTNGEPVMDASVEEDELRGGPEASTRSNVEGRFAFTHLNPGRTKLRVQAQGFALLERTVEVATDSAEVRFVLTPAPPKSDDVPSRVSSEPTVRVSGSVVDAETGLPVEQFSVVLDRRRGTDGDLLGEGRSGWFDWKCPGLFSEQCHLEIQAEGYLPALSETVAAGGGDHHFEFRLSKHTGTSGRVALPEGGAAAGAEVFLVGDATGLRLFEASSPTRKHFLLHSPDDPETRGKTDAEGKFCFKPRAGASGVVAIHAAGCAAVGLNALSNGPVILQPWGRITGQVRSGNGFAANEEVGIEVVTLTTHALHVPCSRNVKTDLEGQFIFERVPPGQYRVYRVRSFHVNSYGIVGHSHFAAVHVTPGSTAEVTLGGGGRGVIGRVRLVPDSLAVNWTQRMQELVRKTPGLVAPKREHFANKNEYLLAWRQHDVAESKYYLRVRSDGSFLVDDVPPGEYRLELRPVEAPSDPLDEDAWMSWPQREFRSLTVDVTVPEAPEGDADEPVDLGVFTVELTPVHPPAE